MPSPVAGVHVNGIDADILPVQNSQSGPDNLFSVPQGDADGVLGNRAVHGRNHSAVHGIGGMLQGKQAFNPGVRDKGSAFQRDRRFFRVRMNGHGKALFTGIFFQQLSWIRKPPQGLCPGFLIGSTAEGEGLPHNVVDVFFAISPVFQKTVEVRIRQRRDFEDGRGSPAPVDVLAVPDLFRYGEC